MLDLGLSALLAVVPTIATQPGVNGDPARVRSGAGLEDFTFTSKHLTAGL